MTVVGSVSATTEHSDGYGPPFEAGTIYEIQLCPHCDRPLLVAGEWHEMMEDPGEWCPSVLLPEDRDRTARELLTAHNQDVNCMLLAVAEARRCVSEAGTTKPLVGAVVARDNSVIASAYRGELKPGEHAEYTLLEGKCKDAILSGSTVYTTLEPCTTRNAPKKPCVEHLIARKVRRVVIGMLDPDERIRGRGVLALRKANIRVDLFPPDLMTELEELNRDFISDREQSKGYSTTPSSNAGPHDSAAAKQEVKILAKHLLGIVRQLPDGSEESIRHADRLFREAAPLSDSDLSELRRSTARAGASAEDAALAVVRSLNWMAKITREVQATPTALGFDYRRVSWAQWKQHWLEAEQGLVALTML